jgi:hypothetical protein
MAADFVMNAELRSETGPFPPGQDPMGPVPSGMGPRRIKALSMLGFKALGWEMLDAGTGVCRLDTS